MDLHKVASTSKPCQWKRSRQQVAPVTLGKINFGRPKQTDTCPKNIDDGNSTESNFRRNFTAKRLTHEQERKFKDLELLVSESSIFTSLVDEECDTSAIEDASEDDTNVLLEPITSLFDSCSINYSEPELRETCSKSFTDYYKNSQVIFDHLTNVTLTKALNKNWKLHRLGRITASNFHEACHLKLDSECRSFVKKIMGYKKFFSTAATRYGTENENKAQEEYKKEMVSTIIILNLNQLVNILMKHFPS